MGKVRRLRQKFHNAAQKSKEKKDNAVSGDQEMMDGSQVMPPPPDPTAVGARGENLFKDIKIGSLALLTQKLPDFDARSSVTSKTFKGLNLTKKEKRKIRHDAWMAKIDHLKTADKKAKESKKKSQTPIVGDLAAMVDALPTLELLMKKSTSKESDVSTKVRSTQPEKKRKDQMIKNISLFQQVLKHPLFVEDEKRTIMEHLKIAMEKEVT